VATNLVFHVSVPPHLVTQIGDLLQFYERTLTPICREWLEGNVGAESVDWELSYSYSSPDGQGFYRANFYFADKTKAAMFRLFWG
jgi:hypothetical protein